jgi:hypothetical protein
MKKRLKSHSVVETPKGTLERFGHVFSGRCKALLVDGSGSGYLLPWITARLQAGTWKSLNAKLHRWRKVNESRAK